MFSSGAYSPASSAAQAVAVPPPEYPHTATGVRELSCGMPSSPDAAMVARRPSSTWYPGWRATIQSPCGPSWSLMVTTHPLVSAATTSRNSF
ncbi:Uncharacterised protein [Mycobacteroides abscessus subsp. abscessus]|nr:Uncharacterised protein [Mycobacteroides abscessus subsp. abscessus]